LPLGHVHTNTHSVPCAHDASAQLGDTYSIYPGQLRPSRPVLGCATITIFTINVPLLLFFFYCFFLSTTTNINTAAVASWNYLSIVLNENKSRLTFQPWKIKIITTWQQQRLWFPATLRIFFSFSFVLLFLCHADHDKFIAIYCSGVWRILSKLARQRKSKKNTQSTEKQKLHNSPQGEIHFCTRFRAMRTQRKIATEH
jgi:hypothetical protein